MLVRTSLVFTYTVSRLLNCYLKVIRPFNEGNGKEEIQMFVIGMVPQYISVSSMKLHLTV